MIVTSPSYDNLRSYNAKYVNVWLMLGDCLG